MSLSKLRELNTQRDFLHTLLLEHYILFDTETDEHKKEQMKEKAERMLSNMESIEHKIRDIKVDVAFKQLAKMKRKSV